MVFSAVSPAADDQTNTDDDTIAGPLLAPIKRIFAGRHPSGPVRVRPWPGVPGKAELAVRAGYPVSIDEIEAACAVAIQQGFERVASTALDHREIGPFLAAGFRADETLDLLIRRVYPSSSSLAATPFALTTGSVERVRRRSWGDVLRVDHTCFEPPWSLDRRSLVDACRATPFFRFRVVRATSGQLAAYAIVGRGDDQGYIQRLAVDPAYRRQGFATALLMDSLIWLERNGASRVHVNTQPSNGAARDLYQRHGFTVQPDRLHVMTRSAVATNAHIDLRTGTA